MEQVMKRRGNLVMPTNCVELDRDEMTYVEGGATYTSDQCQNVLTNLCICSGDILMGIAAGAACVSMLKKLFATFSAFGGPLTWVLNIAVGLIVSAAGKILYGIAYSAVSGKTVSISFTPAPWDFFVDVDWH